MTAKVLVENETPWTITCWEIHFWTCIF
jgi:hypothetical protein